MQSESLAQRKVLRGAVAIVVPAGPHRELPRLYARWVDAGNGEIMLRASHTDGKESLVTHGIGFGETLAPGQILELAPGQMSLTLEGSTPLPLTSGTIRVLDTDGWTFIRFSADGRFGSGEASVSALMDGWYADVAY